MRKGNSFSLFSQLNRSRNYGPIGMKPSLFHGPSLPSQSFHSFATPIAIMQPPWCPSAIVLDIKISWLNLLGTQIGLAWGLGEYGFNRGQCLYCVRKLFMSLQSGCSHQRRSRPRSQKTRQSSRRQSPNFFSCDKALGSRSPLSRSICFFRALTETAAFISFTVLYCSIAHKAAYMNCGAI